MKKITALATALALISSTNIFAADYTPAVTGTAPSTLAKTTDESKKFTYKGTTAKKFTVNDFEFALSSFVTLGAVENATAMAVGAASTRGSNVFTGTSDGGSVSACDDFATVGTLIDADVTGNVNITKKNGCTDSTSS